VKTVVHRYPMTIAWLALVVMLAVVWGYLE
jgi:hypothetical protein